MPAKNNNLKPVVLVFTTAYDPFVGGAEIAILENVKRLQAEFDFYIFTARFRKELPRHQYKEGANIVRLGFGKPWDKFLLPLAAFFYGLGFLFRFRSRPRLIWAVMASYGSIAASTLKLFFPKVPYILTLQEGDTEEHLRKSRLYLINIFGFRYALKTCDFVTAISSYLLEVARRFNYSGEGMVLPNGADLSNFTKEVNSEETEEIKRHLALKGNERIIITTSRLVSKNGIDTIIKSLAVIRKSEKKLPVKFLILGVGSEAHNLKDLARSLGVLDDIIFAGEVSHKNLLKYLKLAEVFVRPSRSEGLGNSFIEAMAAGVPVIGTAVGGIPDFLRDEETGFFVKVDDFEGLAKKILAVLKGEVKKDEIIKAAKKLAIEKFDWEKISKNFSNLFLERIDKFSKPVILLATGIFPPDIGGPATYTNTIAEELSRRNFIVKVITYADSLKNPKSEILNHKQTQNQKYQISNTINYKLITVSRRIPKGIRHFVYFLKCLKNGFLADVFYAQDVVSAGFPSFIASIILRKKYIVKVTGDYAWEQGMTRFGVDDPIEAFEAKKYGPSIEFLRFLQSYVSRLSDKVIVPSEYLKKIVSGWGVKENKITVIYNSAEIPEIKENKIFLRKKLNIGEEEKVLISVGRLVKWKGFDCLLDVFSGMLGKNKNLRLLIIGDGPEREKLELRINPSTSLPPKARLALGGGAVPSTMLGAGIYELGDKVALLGRLPHLDVAKHLKASDIFILNTSYEGFSHQLAEVMSLGVPIVTTRAGGNMEIVKDGENGILVDYNDKNAINEAVEKLLIDSALYSKLSENGMKTAKQFTKKRMVDDLINVLSSK